MERSNVQFDLNINPPVSIQLLDQQVDPWV